MTLAALFGVLATLSLGRWQLSRAAQKEALQAAIDQRGRLAPLEGAGWLDLDPPSLLHRPARLVGRFVAKQTLFLDNRQMHGRPGFYVLTPFMLEGSDRAIVVQRGWVPRNFIDRTALPTIPTPGGTVQVEGRIAPAPAKLFEFEGAVHGPIRQNVELDSLERESGLSLLPISLLQTTPEAAVGGNPVNDGLLRDWPEVVSGVERHYGYAFQWFGLAALIAFLYVWYQFIVPRRRRGRTVEGGKLHD